MSMMSVSLFAKSKPAKAQEPAKTEDRAQKETDVRNLSIAFGHLLSKSINDMGVSFDLELVIQGLKDASKGMPSPLSEAECMTAINQEHKKNYEALAEKNLKEAENFLSTEAKQEGICSLEDGKVLYKILSEGQGSNVVEDHGKISIKYKGSLLNGDVFGESSQEEILDVSQIVSGLRDGMVGMKEGEKRLIHIHPSKAYGSEGMLPPNSLLSFEIEVAKAKIEEVAQTNQIQEDQATLAPESEIR